MPICLAAAQSVTPRVRCTSIQQCSSGISRFGSDIPRVCTALPRERISSALPNDETKRLTETSVRRKRRRHRFQVDSIPSFQDFQQQQRARGLYRQFLRLVWHTSQRGDFLSQIRHEFRNVAVVDDWHRKRAISEGGRRLKELSAMLGTSVAAKSVSKDNGDGPENHSSGERSTRAPPSTSELWPWQRREGALQNGPVSYPPKSK
jgi:hypothetical protein